MCHLHPKWSALYRVGGWVRVGASAYQAFRAPTLNELYRSFGFGGFLFEANGQLSPARLSGVDAKIEGGNVQNVGRTRTVGGEASLTWQPLTPLSVQLGYAYTDSVITEFPGHADREGRFVPHISRHQVSGGLSRSHPQLADVTIQVRYLSRQYADDANTQPIADFIVIDASIQRNLFPA
ncbi:MAG: TonB-dependent receptor [Nitrospira sp.]|nr:TonB-dependent receptor [Nitrospira sp.]